MTTTNPTDTTDFPTPPEYDAAASICVNQHRDRMIEMFEQMGSGDLLVTVLADIVAHEDTNSVQFYFSATGPSLLSLMASQEAAAEIDILAHAAGFTDNSRTDFDRDGVSITYHLSVDAWRSESNPGEREFLAAVEESIEADMTLDERPLPGAETNE